MKKITKTAQFINYLLIILVLSCSFGMIPIYAQENSSTIDINSDIHYQSIEGFGGFGAKRVIWAGENNFAFTDKKWVDSLNNLGVSIYRSSVPADFEITNDNKNPNSLNLKTIEKAALSTNSTREDNFYKQLPFWKDLAKNKIKMIFSIWSPPVWMKNENKLEGGTIKDTQNNFDEFAERSVAFVKLFKKHTGVEPYALSIQNEPVFSLWYASTKITPQQYSRLLATVAKRFKKENIKTLLFGPENPPGDGTVKWIKDYLDQIIKDGNIKYLDAIAYHAYSPDGIGPLKAEPNFYNYFKTFQSKYHKKIWSTETTELGEDKSWAKAFILAQDLNNMLQYGNVSAFTYWQISDQFYVNNLKNDFTPTKVYYTAQQYYKFIKPGFQRIETKNNNINIQQTAFLNPKTKKVVIVMVNGTSKSATIKLKFRSQFGENDKYKLYLTDQGANNCKLQSTINSNDKFILPSQSIITLEGK